MKTLNFYKEKGINTEKDAFEYFINNLKQSINSYSYFVDVEKVISNCKGRKEILLDLEKVFKYDNLEDSLKEFKYVAMKHKKNFVKTLLILIASRKSAFDEKKSGYLQICNWNLKETQLTFMNYYLNWPKEEKEINYFIEKWYFFLKETQIFTFIKENKISLVDYIFGVEVGLNTHARKNRGGTKMEDIVHFYFRKTNLKSIEILKEVEYGNINTKCPKSIFERKADFVIKTPTNDWIIETNCFTTQGSKINKTVEDFIVLFRSINGLNDKTKFLWITDGFGLKTVKNRFFEAFKEIDYVLNIHMLEENYLKILLSN